MNKEILVIDRVYDFIGSSKYELLRLFFPEKDFCFFSRLFPRWRFFNVPGYIISGNVSGGKSIWLNVKMRNLITGEFALARTWSFYRFCRSRFSSNRHVLSPFSRLLLEAVAHDYLGKKNMAPPLLFFDVRKGILLRSFWPGETLGSFLEKATTLDEKKTLAEIVVDFVKRMHGIGFFHGDLSLDNILFREESLESIYAIDFEWAWMNFNYEDLSEKELRALDLNRFFFRARRSCPEFAVLLEQAFCEKF